jgi:hypothetical protein
MKTHYISNPTAKPLFELGRIVATPGALALVTDPRELIPYLRRHHRGDWMDTGAAAEGGEMSDAELNDMAILDGSRIFTVVHVAVAKIWIITEAKGDDGRRASTCILTPEEY